MLPSRSAARSATRPPWRLPQGSPHDQALGVGECLLVPGTWSTPEGDRAHAAPRLLEQVRLHRRFGGLASAYHPLGVKGPRRSSCTHARRRREQAARRAVSEQAPVPRRRAHSPPPPTSPPPPPLSPGPARTPTPHHRDAARARGAHRRQRLRTLPRARQPRLSMAEAGPRFVYETLIPFSTRAPPGQRHRRP